MDSAHCYLVVAEDPARLSHVTATLHRRFPKAVVQTCCDSALAIEAMRSRRTDAIVVHRSSDMDEIPLIEALRSTSRAPIISFIGRQRQEQALAAGATRCLEPEEWLLVGSVIAELLPVGET